MIKDAETIVIPGYTIVREIGKGGMARVYLACQESIGRDVALKIMSPVLNADPSFGHRFLREAKIAAQLHHPNIIAVHDVGVHDGLHYIAMEYHPGGTLTKSVIETMDVVRALTIVRDIAQSLGYADQKGFVHRDVKSDNIIFREDGSAVLTDFGIAKAANSSTQMTMTGSVIGTPHYMSPEQARGKKIDGRSDLYSLGVVFYEVLVGHVPYQAEDNFAICVMHVNEPIPTLPDVLRKYQPMLNRLLAKNPDDRYQNGMEFVSDIEAMGEIDSTPLPRNTPSVSGSMKPVVSGDYPASNIKAVTQLANKPIRFTPRPQLDKPVKNNMGGLKWLVGLSILVATLVTLSLLFDSSTDVERLYQQALLAHEQKNYYGSDSSAINLLSTVLDIQKDHKESRLLLENIRRELITNVKQNIKSNKLELAKEQLSKLHQFFDDDQLKQLALNLEASKKLHLDRVNRQLTDDEHSNITAFMNSDRLAFPDLLLAVDSYKKLVNLNSTDSRIVQYKKILLSAIKLQLETAIFDKNDIRVTEMYQLAEGIDFTSLELDQLEEKIESYLDKANQSRTPTLASQLKEANAALANNRLSNKSNGAIELFQRVLAVDAHNKNARDGLLSVYRKLLIIAEQAINADNSERAGRMLVVSQQLSSNYDWIDEASDYRQFRQRLNSIKSVPTGRKTEIPANLSVSDMMERAERNFSAPGQKSKDTAYAYYRAVVAKDRGNRAAIRRLQSGVLAQLKRADRSISIKKYKDAQLQINAAMVIYPEDREIASLQRRLNRALSEGKGNDSRSDNDRLSALKLASLLSAAKNAEADAFANPQSRDKLNHAYVKYLELLSQDKASSEAKRGLKRLGSLYLSQASSLIEQGRLEQAKQLIERAQNLNANPSELRKLKSLLSQAAGG